MCEIKVIYLGPRPFVCNIILCEQHRQVHVNKYSCVTAVFLFKVTVHQHTNTVRVLGT